MEDRAIIFFVKQDWAALLRDQALAPQFYRYSGMLEAGYCDCNPMPPHYDKEHWGTIICAPASGGGFGGSDAAHKNCICPRHQTKFARAHENI